MSKAKLNADLEKLEKKLEKLNEKKEACINKQNELYDKQVGSSSSAIEKQIDLDFELASQIEDVSKQLKNKKAQIKRSENKNMKKDIAGVETENITADAKPIRINKLELEGRIWWDKTYGNPYHTSRAIINDEFVVVQDSMSYGSGSQFEVSIAKKLEKLGIKGISEEPLFIFCEKNDIEFLIDSDEGLKRDLVFKNNEIWEDAISLNLKFKSKYDDQFEEIISSVEEKYKDSSNESKAIAVYLESMISKDDIAGISKRIKDEYGIEFVDFTTSVVNICDTQVIKDVYTASNDLDINFDFTRKDITLKDVYVAYKDVLLDKKKTLESLGKSSGDKNDFFNKRIEKVNEAIEKMSNKDVLDESVSKKSTTKNR